MAVKDIRRPVVGKWFFDAGFSRPGMVSEIGWYHFRLCAFRLTEAPADNSTLRATPHDGFIVSFLVWLPIWL